MKEEIITITQNLNAEVRRLDNEISDINKQLNSLPPGKLIVTRYQTRFKWYVNDGKKLKYIPKSERRYAEELAKRKYLSLKLEDLTQERNALNYYLPSNSRLANQADLLISDPRYYPLLSPYFKSTKQKVTEWLAETYEHNTKYPEQLTQKSISGNVVRSKSESLIDMALYVNQIPFRYEALLLLNDIPVYPDFTILHPNTQQIYYWEHFGMMDNEKYAKNVYSKLTIYTENNIIPSINLITTFETKEHPLSSELVEKVIQYYFT
ncbi:MAG: ATPase [Lachnospiraceae bacterium]|nr:ATPase [Lachnospiraceae bacterium]MDD3616557.1 ATPase [Lachnospiraceae bacterium]